MAKTIRAAKVATKTRKRRDWGGSLYLRADRPGQLWARWVDAAGRRHVQGTGTVDRVEAERFLARVTGAVAADEERGVRAVSVRSFALAEYLPVLRSRVVPAHADGVASHVLGPLVAERAKGVTAKSETARQRDERRRGGFADFVQAVALHDVSTADVERYFAKLRTDGGASPATCARFAASLSGMFRAAVDAGAARENPVRRARLPKAQQFEPHAMTPEDVSRVIANAPANVRPALTLLADTGLRLGELLRLTWPHVADDSSQIVVATSKSGRTRAVPVPARSRAILDELRKTRVVPLRGADVVAAGPRAGKSWSKSRLQRLFRDAARAAGLPVTPDSPVGVRIHDIRHAYASALARNGVALSIVANLIGDSVQVTSSRYARHVPHSAAVLAVQTLEGRPAEPQAAQGSA